MQFYTRYRSKGSNYASCSVTLACGRRSEVHDPRSPPWHWLDPIWCTPMIYVPCIPSLQIPHMPCMASIPCGSKPLEDHPLDQFIMIRNPNSLVPSISLRLNLVGNHIVISHLLGYVVISLAFVYLVGLVYIMDLMVWLTFFFIASILFPSYSLLTLEGLLALLVKLEACHSCS